MKKITAILMIALLSLSISCKKQGTVSNNKIASSKNPADNSLIAVDKTNYFDVGGTIGCFINLTSSSSPSFGDNDAYDTCMDTMLAGTNTLGNTTPSGNPPHIQPPPCYPCMIPHVVEPDIMEYFFQLLGEQVPVDAQDFERVRNKIAAYGTIILEVYTVNGILVIPEDRFERTELLLNYNGTLPSGIEAYVGFVYGKYFGMPPAWEQLLYPLVLQGNSFVPPALDVNGRYSIFDYNVKVKRG